MEVESKVYLMDCIEGMKMFEDNHFDLAIVDPPYGINRSGQKLSINNKNVKHDRKYFEDKKWDKSIPCKGYFQELFRVSKNQVIWGGNYFTEHLNPSRAWIFWYKGQNDLTMSDGEMAWTSFDKVTRQIEINRGTLIGSIHPTQKPIKLYEWILKNYAKENDKILDTHLGSGSSRIAAHKHNFDFTGFEIDLEYFEKADKRFNDYKNQLTLF